MAAPAAGEAVAERPSRSKPSLIAVSLVLPAMSSVEQEPCLPDSGLCAVESHRRKCFRRESYRSASARIETCEREITKLNTAGARLVGVKNYADLRSIGNREGLVPTPAFPCLGRRASR